MYPQGRSARLLLPILVLLSVLPSASRAGWTLLTTFSRPIGCGFFFDAQNGFIGTGIRNGTSQSALIYKTTDGGASWTPTTPASTISGAITSIQMVDRKHGYASFFSNFSGLASTIWETVDGGNTWSVRSGPLGRGTCVYATSTSIVLTMWSGAGGVGSIAGGAFNTAFAPSSMASNGIDFTDDLTGVVTNGPMSSPSSYYTTNGGVSWTPVNGIGETWSVYGVKGTKTFFTAGEQDNSVPVTVYTSTNGGASWGAVYTFPFSFGATGHIAGSGTRLYIQSTTSTTAGVFRSDNGGVAWKPVGGPSNSRDTRFVVTGCQGETVYAFDQLGNVFKTIDGGDGTLAASIGGDPLSLLSDSLRLFTTYCQPKTGRIVLQNASCALSSLDSIRILNDTSRQFSVTKPGASLMTGGSDTVTVRFDPAHDGRDTVTLLIYGSQNGVVVQRRVTIASLNATGPTPTLGTIVSVEAGGHTVIPIYIQPTKDPFSIASFSVKLDLNTDVLTPLKAVMLNTLSDGGTTQAFVTFPTNQVTCLVTPAQPIAESSDLTKPLIYIETSASVSDSLGTDILLSGFSINGLQPLGLCTTPEAQFTLKTRCGDSTIALKLGGTDILTLLGVTPNPSHGGELSIQFRMHASALTKLEVLDATGKLVAQPLSDVPLSIGAHTVRLVTTDWPSGDYFLRLQADSQVITRTLVQIR